MHYVMGPERSAEALARKNGLRADEWVWLGCVGDVEGRLFAVGADLVHETHDAWQLPEYERMVARVSL